MQKTRIPARLIALYQRRALAAVLGIGAFAPLPVYAADDLPIAKVTASLTVHVEGIPRDGKLVVGLYDEASYPAFALIHQTLAVRRGTADAIFPRLPPGTYALMGFLDANGNGRPDAGEPQGTSNDAKPGDFEKAAVSIGPGPNTLSLRLHED